MWTWRRIALLAWVGGCTQGDGGQFGDEGTIAEPTASTPPRPGRVYLVDWPPAAPGLADAALATWTGTPGSRAGERLDVVPDADGDGADELLILASGWEQPLRRSTPTTTGSTTTQTQPETIRGGRAEVVWSADLVAGDHLFEGAGTSLLGQAGSWYLDVAYVGDLDGDGHGEVAVGSDGDDALIELYTVTGGTASLLTAVAGESRSSYGSALAPVGDLDGDGAPEVLVADVSAGYGDGQSGGQVDLWTAAALVSAGQPAASVAGVRDGAPLGYRRETLAALPDVNGDGVPEVVLAQPGHPVGDAYDAGLVAIYDGAALVGAGDLAVADARNRIEGTGDNDHVGSLVVGLPDLDGDGLGELAVAGGTGEDTENPGPWHAPGVYVFRGADLVGVRHLEDAAGRLDATAVYAAPDLDGDGVGEVAVLAGAGLEQVLAVYPGGAVDLVGGGMFAGVSPLATVAVPYQGWAGGVAVAWLADGAGGWRLAVGLPHDG